MKYVKRLLSVFIKRAQSRRVILLGWNKERKFILVEFV